MPRTGFCSCTVSMAVFLGAHWGRGGPLDLPRGAGMSGSVMVAKASFPSSYSVLPCVHRKKMDIHLGLLETIPWSRPDVESMAGWSSLWQLTILLGSTGVGPQKSFPYLPFSLLPSFPLSLQLSHLSTRSMTAVWCHRERHSAGTQRSFPSLEPDCV